MNYALIFILFGVLVAGLAILFMMSRGKSQKLVAMDKNLIKNRWQEIQNLVAIGKPSALKQAVVEADKLLDYVLKSKHYRGHTMAERMKSAAKDFSDNNGVWTAHKIRNLLVHEQTEIFVDQLRDAVNHFEKALKDLGGLNGRIS
jgi:hypothetical protein